MRHLCQCASNNCSCPGVCGAWCRNRESGMPQYATGRALAGLVVHVAGIRNAQHTRWRYTFLLPKSGTHSTFARAKPPLSAAPPRVIINLASDARSRRVPADRVTHEDRRRAQPLLPRHVAATAQAKADCRRRDDTRTMRRPNAEPMQHRHRARAARCRQVFGGSFASGTRQYCDSARATASPLRRRRRRGWAPMHCRAAVLEDARSTRRNNG